MSIGDGIDLNFANPGDVLRKKILKLATLRPPLDARLLPDALLDDALLHAHAIASGVAPADGAMMVTGDQ
jgi:hypothetical protein